MKYALLTVVISALGFVSCKENPKKEIGNNSVKENTLVNIYYPVKANFKNKTSGEGDTLYAKLDTLSFTIYPNGKIEEFQKNTKAATYKLKTKDIVEAAYLCIYKNSLIIYYTETDDENAGSFVESFDMKTQRRTWKADTYGFNLGQPVNKNDVSYISTIGFVGKLNLSSGKYIWKFDGLYDNKTYSFNQFDSILFAKNDVIFISKNSQKKAIDSIIVNDLTGKITIKK